MRQQAKQVLMSPKEGQTFAKRGPSFSAAWLGYIGLLGLLGFVWKPVQGLRFLSLFCVFFAAPYGRNPRFLLTVIAYAFCHGIAFVRNCGILPRPGGYSQKTDFVLPFEGEWLAAAGGPSRKDSHSWHVLNQRYAYDFLIQDEHGRTHTKDGQELDDYHCYGRPILAPADGVIIRINDNIQDNPRVGTLDWRARDFRGNFVLIKHKGAEYSHLAHFQTGSLKVQPGDCVKRGQVIGLCGNSGHSTEPHLHFHVQNRANFFLGLGLPVRFGNFVVKQDWGYQRTKSGYVAKGQKVMNAEESALGEEGETDSCRKKMENHDEKKP